MRSGAQLVARALEVEGVRLVFGNPTPNDIALFDILAESGQVRPVVVSQETHAVRMAIGAWQTGRIPACITVSGDAGITAAIPGLAEASSSGIPLLALAIGASDAGIGRLGPFCSASQCPKTGTAVCDTIRHAADQARQVAGPIAIGLPTSLLDTNWSSHEIETSGAHPAPSAPKTETRSDQRPAAREALLSRLATRLGPTARFIADPAIGARTQEQLGLGADQYLTPAGAMRTGSAIPVAIGAKLAQPALPIIALADEDGFLASGTELLTAVTTGAAVIVVIMRTRRHDDTLPRFDAGSLADAIGVEWIRLDRDGAVGDALDYLAFVTGQGRPMVLETVIDEPASAAPGLSIASSAFGSRLSRLFGQLRRRLRP